MEIFNSFFDFFGFELLSEASTIPDVINSLLQIGLGIFIVCFFIKSIFALMLNLFNTRIM